MFYSYYNNNNNYYYFEKTDGESIKQNVQANLNNATEASSLHDAPHAA